MFARYIRNMRQRRSGGKLLRFLPEFEPEFKFENLLYLKGELTEMMRLWRKKQRTESVAEAHQLDAVTRATPPEKAKKTAVTAANTTKNTAQATNIGNKRTSKNLVWRYSKELINDHRFWKQMFLLKGGMGVVTTGLLLTPVIMALPAVALTAAVVLGGVLTVGAIGSIAVGATGVVRTFGRTRKKINAEFGENRTDIAVPKDEIALSQTRSAFKDMLTNRWPIRPIVNSRLAKKINKSRAVNTFKNFMNESDNLLDTLTVKNSALTVTIFGGMLLAVEIVAAPLFFAVAFLAYTVASLGFGLYMGYEGLRDMAKRRKEERLRKKMERERANSPVGKLSATKTRMAEGFKAGGQKLKRGVLAMKFWGAADKEENTGENKNKTEQDKDKTLQKQPRPANKNIPATAQQKKKTG
ncbi:MAG: hypothetical protein EA357_08615 [Micavibrio sp.]|nr:MAG: hypothetical protein EA357_08615 [Micavibrio sp.]